MGCIHASMKVKHSNKKYATDTVHFSDKQAKFSKEQAAISDARLTDITLRMSKLSDNSEGSFPDYYENIHSSSSTSLENMDTVSLPDITQHPTYQTVLMKGRRSCKHRPGMNSMDCVSSSTVRKSSKASFEAETSILDCKICHKNHTQHLVNKLSSNSLTPNNVTSKNLVASNAGPKNSSSTNLTAKNDTCKNENMLKKHNLKLTKNNANSLANLIAVNALFLAAPASDAILNNRKNEWVQLAGHPGSFAPASSKTVWKKRMTKIRNEVNAYRAIMEESARDIVPKFYREVEHQGEYFMELQDLLQSFHDPNVVDIKMGVRTFLEPEVMNPVVRRDLYEKMVAIDPNAPTPDEHCQKAVTKLRYMQFREQTSSTAHLGFRIEAIRMSGQKPLMNWKSTRSRAQIAAVLARFCNHDARLLATIARRLKEIRQKFELSHFFRTHEIIGSSLLILYDSSGKCGAWMIDFAKTLPMEGGQKITHRLPWICGNREDGYLFGLDNLIEIFEKPEPQDTSCLDCFLNNIPEDT